MSERNDDLKEDNINGRRHQWKMTSMEDNLNGRQPQWKTTSMEDTFNGRHPQWKMTLMEDYLYIYNQFIDKMQQ